jgi:hypothetical protein
MALDLAKALNDERGKADIHPCHVNRASEIGHPCLEYLRLARVAWDKRLAPDPVLASIFHEGNLTERDCVQMLLSLGYEIYEQQKSGVIRGRNGEVLVSYHLDWRMRDTSNGEVLAVEHKRVSPFQFPKLNTIEDLFDSDRVHIRKWPAQLQVYLLGAENEKGLQLLRNAWTGVYKQIEYRLDFEYTESLLAKAERVNAAVENEQPLPKLEEAATCFDCPLRHVCAPEVIGDALAIGSDEFEAWLVKRDELKAAMAETGYKELEKERDALSDRIKEYLAANDGRVITGMYLAELKPTHRMATLATSYNRLVVSKVGGED